MIAQAFNGRMIAWKQGVSMNIKQKIEKSISMSTFFLLIFIMMVVMIWARMLKRHFYLVVIMVNMRQELVKHKYAEYTK